MSDTQIIVKYFEKETHFKKIENYEEFLNKCYTDFEMNEEEKQSLKIKVLDYGDEVDIENKNDFNENLNPDDNNQIIYILYSKEGEKKNKNKKTEVISNEIIQMSNIIPPEENKEDKNIKENLEKNKEQNKIKNENLEENKKQNKIINEENKKQNKIKNENLEENKKQKNKNENINNINNINTNLNLNQIDYSKIQEENEKFRTFLIEQVKKENQQLEKTLKSIFKKSINEVKSFLIGIDQSVQNIKSDNDSFKESIIQTLSSIQQTTLQNNNDFSNVSQINNTLENIQKSLTDNINLNIQKYSNLETQIKNLNEKFDVIQKNIQNENNNKKIPKLQFENIQRNDFQIENDEDVNLQENDKNNNNKKNTKIKDSKDNKNARNENVRIIQTPRHDDLHDDLQKRVLNQYNHNFNDSNNKKINNSNNEHLNDSNNEYNENINNNFQIINEFYGCNFEEEGIELTKDFNELHESKSQTIKLTLLNNGTLPWPKNSFIIGKSENNVLEVKTNINKNNEILPNQKLSIEIIISFNKIKNENSHYILCLKLLIPNKESEIKQNEYVYKLNVRKSLDNLINKSSYISFDKNEQIINVLAQENAREKNQKIYSDNFNQHYNNQINNEIQKKNLNNVNYFLNDKTFVKIKERLEEDYGLSNSGWSDELLKEKIRKYYKTEKVIEAFKSNEDEGIISTICDLIGEDILNI